jgi:hypothetical protein
MNFYQGKITIKQTCTGTGTYPFGPGGITTGSRLILQGDGNLVIYNGATGIWSSATNGNADDVMFFQPDGNLVIYTLYGKTLWASGSQNAAADS